MSRSLLSKRFKMLPEQMIPQGIHAKYREDTNPMNVHRTHDAKGGGGGKSEEDKKKPEKSPAKLCGTT